MEKRRPWGLGLGTWHVARRVRVARGRFSWMGGQSFTTDAYLVG